MAGKSSLDPDNYDARLPKAPKGHDVKSLGPSDSSDSGSDMAGPGLLDEDALNFDRGTNQDSEAGRDDIADAGPSVGDRGMRGDSDRYGTGEHKTAGKDPRVRDATDVDTDRLVGESEAGLGAGLDQAEEALIGISDEEIEAAAGTEDDSL